MKSITNFFTVIIAGMLMGCQQIAQPSMALQQAPWDLHFEELPEVWDEGIPLGNGAVGALIWKKDGKLRMSLDRADLWDLRPMENLNIPEWKYSWVIEQWQNDNYKAVQDRFDVPYDKLPAPTKIPGAALEIDISEFGPVEYVHLYTKEALCEIKWKSGVRFWSYVHAVKPIGMYRFSGVKKDPEVNLIPPPYAAEGNDDHEVTSLEGHDLRRLGYPAGKVIEKKHGMTYKQEGWNGFKYQIDVIGNTRGETQWSITTVDKPPISEDLPSGSFEEDFESHKQWWSDFWSKSSVSVPDPVIQKQWILEMYKFGSAARQGAPPISLQAVWTADNGQIPPWKGDFHHDLNTQLSYWPAYSGNHLEQEIGFLDWLWKHKETFMAYTKNYYETEGLNVPGVTTLAGEPMGGWIQYSFGPTVSSWLGQHFYWHWRYTMDREFLKQKAYPWIQQVAVYLEAVSQVNNKGIRQLPISSSPEIYDNSREAWFGETTNFDLSLIRWTYEKAIELAMELDRQDDAERWERLLSQWPELAIDQQTGLMFAPEAPYHESHRHFSHQMAYHPLGLVDFSKGESHQEIIRNTIATLEDIGSSLWVGYSFSWMANLKARAFDGDGAAEYLKIFATSFCLPNSFHVNGDQTGKGYSNFTYRPFTLEGNFAYAAGLQEMLIQSHTGIVHIFPAVPADWLDVSFNQLRTQGAFLVSAKKENGTVKEIQINAEKGEN